MISHSFPKVGRPGRVRAVVGVVGAAALALVAVATAAPAVAGEPPTLPVTGRAALIYATSVSLPPGYQYAFQGKNHPVNGTVPSGLPAEVTVIQVRGHSSANWGVDTFDPGQFPVERFERNATRTVLAGHVVYRHVRARNSPQLWAWQVSGNRWIELTLSDVNYAGQAATIIDNVHPNVVEDVHLPMRIGWLPAGVKIDDGGYYAQGAGSTVPNTTVYFLAPPRHLAKNITFYPTLSLQTATGAGITLGKGSPIVINGHAGRYRSQTVGAGLPAYSQLSVRYGDLVITVTGAYTKATVTRIAESMTMATDPDNMNTWFNATR